MATQGSKSIYENSLGKGQLNSTFFYLSKNVAINSTYLLIKVRTVGAIALCAHIRQYSMPPHAFLESHLGPNSFQNMCAYFQRPSLAICTSDIFVLETQKKHLS